MINAKSLKRWFALLPLIVVWGCAPAYHSYSGCDIDCKYCVPPPLPYVHYDDCACHACAVAPYLGTGVPSPDDGGAPNSYEADD